MFASIVQVMKLRAFSCRSGYHTSQEDIGAIERSSIPITRSRSVKHLGDFKASFRHSPWTERFGDFQRSMSIQCRRGTSTSYAPGTVRSRVADATCLARRQIRPDVAAETTIIDLPK